MGHPVRVPMMFFNCGNLYGKINANNLLMWIPSMLYDRIATYAGNYCVCAGSKNSCTEEQHTDVINIFIHQWLAITTRRSWCSWVICDDVPGNPCHLFPSYQWSSSDRSDYFIMVREQYPEYLGPPPVAPVGDHQVPTGREGNELASISLADLAAEGFDVDLISDIDSLFA